VDNNPIPTSIRRIIFENFNDADLKFNNDQVFEILKQNEKIDPSLTTIDMEVYFKELCDAEICVILVRILIHNGSNYLNQLRKFSVIHVKKKVILYRLRIGSAKILVVVLLFSFVFFRRLLKSFNHW